MPKAKTHKGAKKRFRLTASGKLMHRKAGTSHLAVRMSQKRKRNLRGTAAVDVTNEDNLKAALGKHSY
ncbi:MAG: 50S ribosomal protein L35 [Pirellulaceae bacterium]|nr:50S ribosomal protein L35 [Pirellulaceae bacterium]